MQVPLMWSWAVPLAPLSKVKKFRVGWAAHPASTATDWAEGQASESQDKPQGQGPLRGAYM